LQERYEINVEIGWRYRDAVDAEWLRGVAGRVLAAEGVARAEAGIVIAGDRKVRDLNRRYRGEDAPTDVLSFCLTENAEGFVLPPDETTRLGDVVISLPTARRQAEAAGHSVEHEVEILLVHGVLHLLGYDHVEEKDARRMRASEKARLSAPGVL